MWLWVALEGRSMALGGIAGAVSGLSAFGIQPSALNVIPGGGHRNIEPLVSEVKPGGALVVTGQSP
jgi:hypothetical protein